MKDTTTLTLETTDETAAKSNPRAISTRIVFHNKGNAGGQRAHDLRIGNQPAYVQTDKSKDNRVLVEPLLPTELWDICVQRRSLRPMKRSMRSNVSIQISGLISMGKKTQDWFQELDPATQDEAMRWMADKLAERLNTTLTGLVVHVDETALHAHYQMPAYSLDGKPLHHEMNKHSMSHLQDVVHAAGKRYMPLLERGHKKQDRIAAGADPADTVHRKVSELHNDLGPEIEARKAELQELLGQVEDAQTKLEKNERLLHKAENGQKRVKEKTRAAYKRRIGAAKILKGSLDRQIQDKNEEIARLEEALTGLNGRETKAKEAAEALQAALAAIEAAAEGGRITGEITPDLELPECDLTDGERQAISAALEDPTSAKTIQAAWNAATHEAAAKAAKRQAENATKTLQAAKEAAETAKQDADNRKADADAAITAADNRKAEAQKLKAGLSAAAELAVSHPLKAGEQPSEMALQNEAFAAVYHDEATRSAVMSLYHSISEGVIENQVIRDAMDAIDTARAEGRISQPFEERAANTDLTDAERRKIEDAIAHDSNVAASIERAWSQAHKLAAKEQDLNDDIEIVTAFAPLFSDIGDLDKLRNPPQPQYELADRAHKKRRLRALSDAWFNARKNVIAVIDTVIAKGTELTETIDTLEEANEIIGRRYGKGGSGRLHEREREMLEDASDNPKTSVIGRLWSNAHSMFQVNLTRKRKLEHQSEEIEQLEEEAKTAVAQLNSALNGIPPLLNYMMVGKKKLDEMTPDMRIASTLPGIKPLLEWIHGNREHLALRPPAPSRKPALSAVEQAHDAAYQIALSEAAATDQLGDHSYLLYSMVGHMLTDRWLPKAVSDVILERSADLLTSEPDPRALIAAFIENIQGERSDDAKPKSAPTSPGFTM